MNEWKTGNPPDELCKYIVTYDDYTVDTCIWMRNYSYSRLKNNSKYHWRNPRGEVLAYMELPDPYPIKEMLDGLEEMLENINSEEIK